MNDSKIILTYQTIFRKKKNKIKKNPEFQSVLQNSKRYNSHFFLFLTCTKTTTQNCGLSRGPKKKKANPSNHQRLTLPNAALTRFIKITGH